MSDRQDLAPLAALAEEFARERDHWTSAAEQATGRAATDYGYRAHVWEEARERLQIVLGKYAADPMRMEWERNVLAEFLTHVPDRTEDEVVDYLHVLTRAMVDTRETTRA